MARASAERVAAVFVEVADTLVADFDLVEFLQIVTTRSSQLVDAVAAGLLLSDERGRLQFMAASSTGAETLELFQVQTNQGPCQDAFRTGEPVVNADLATAGDRWPDFAPRAVRAGFRSVHAFPLRLRGEIVGALNLFGTDTGELAPSDVLVVQALADIATIGLLQERAIRRGEELTAQLQLALDTRVVIEQAKGAVAQLQGTGVDEAFELIRAHARRHQLHLGDVARAVLHRPTAVPELTVPRGPRPVRDEGADGA